MHLNVAILDTHSNLYDHQHQNMDGGKASRYESSCEYTE